MYFIGVNAYVFCSIYHIKDVFLFLVCKKIIPIDRKKKQRAESENYNSRLTLPEEKQEKHGGGARVKNTSGQNGRS